MELERIIKDKSNELIGRFSLNNIGYWIRENAEMVMGKI